MEVWTTYRAGAFINFMYFSGSSPAGLIIGLLVLVIAVVAVVAVILGFLWLRR